MISGKLRFLALTGALLGGATFVVADDPNDFIELDGNSVDTNIASLPDDWNLLNGAGACTTPGVPTGCGGGPGGSLARSFISGSASVAVFAGGGSKDPSDITSWKWKSGGTPDKDAVTNGYAAAYKAQDGHLILAFGADRFAVNGDANIGFWFFQQDVHPTGAGTGGGSPFSGVHVRNDIFVVSAFSQGGGVSTITVYAWDPDCGTSHSGINSIVSSPGVGDCGDSNLRLKFASTPSGTCSGVATGCAIVNGAAIDVTWPYLAKFGSASMNIPEGGFYEGGIDVTTLLGPTTVECFSSFLIETRTSQTTSAVLKDFVGGSFSICGLSATKTCAGDGVLNAGGTSIHYLFNGTATNTGIAGLTNVTIYDVLPTGSTNVVFKKGSSAPTVPSTFSTVTTTSCPTGATTGATCADLGSLSAGTTEYWSVEFDSTSGGVTNHAIAAASTTGGSPGACTASGTVCSTDQQDMCSANPSNSITITKNCAVPTGYPNATLPGTQLVTSGGLAAVQVNFSGVIENTGQTQLTGITLTDNPSATLSYTWPGTAGTLAGRPSGGDCTTVPNSCAKYSGNYLPGGVTLNDLGSSSGRYGFTDEIKVTGATAALGTSPGKDSTCISTFDGTTAQACATQTCHICPGSPSGLCGGN